MSWQLVVLPSFRRNRREQLGYIAERDPQAAVRMGDRIWSVIELLPDNAAMGRAGRVNGTRETVVVGTPYILVYRVRPKTQRVEIVRMLHGAQQWPPPGRC